MAFPNKCPVCGQPHGRGRDHSKCSKLLQANPAKYGAKTKTPRSSPITASSLKHFASL